MWGEQGTSCPKKQVGQQHSGEELKDIPEGRERAGCSSRKGTAGPMLRSWSLQESPLSKFLNVPLARHLQPSQLQLGASRMREGEGEHRAVTWCEGRMEV